MNLFKSTTLGSYNPILRSISINDEIIKKNFKDEYFVSHLVLLHENTHWHQMMATTMGQFLTTSYLFRRQSISNILNGLKQVDPSIKIGKPLNNWASEYARNCTNTAVLDLLLALINDIRSYENVRDYFENEFTIEDLKSDWSEINQGLFTMYDVYIDRIKHYMGADFQAEKLIEKNKEFWDKTENYKVLLDKSGVILSFEELIECAARLVEFKYYNNYSILIGPISTIDPKQLFFDKYVEKPVEILKKFIQFDSTEKVIDLISLLIFVSINPPIMPHFQYCWDENISVMDIHPGIRFWRICQLLQEKYKTIDDVLEETNLELIICAELKWPSSTQLANNFNNIYGTIHKKVCDFGDRIIDPKEVHEMEYLFSQLCKASNLRLELKKYFINAGEYLISSADLEIAKKIDTELHCPIIYNSKLGLYQVNIGDFKIEAIKDSGEKEIISDSRKLTDKLQQQCVNHFKDGFFYALDNQLLFDKGRFDLTKLPKLDAPKEIMDQLLEIYNQSNGVALKDIVVL